MRSMLFNLCLVGFVLLGALLSAPVSN